MTVAERALVTGASRGLGEQVARRLAADGTRVVACARDPDRLAAVVDDLPGRGHEALCLDVTDAAAWRSASQALADLDAVVCAAGTIGPIGSIADIDPESFETTLRVNVVGVLLALQATAPALERSRGSAVVFSGGGATGPFARFDAYAASKAAVVRLAENLAASGLRVNAVAPGFLVTDMQRDVLQAGPERVGEAYYERVHAAVETDAGDDDTRAPALVSMLLSDAGRGISGKLLSAQWDPWEDDGFLDRLRCEPNLATLRRVDDQFYAEKER